MATARRPGVAARSTYSLLPTRLRLDELWPPGVLTAVDDSLVKVAKVQGSRTRHNHADEDALFCVLPDTRRAASAHETACVTGAAHRHLRRHPAARYADATHG
jgi:hypothetical protein